VHKKGLNSRLLNKPLVLVDHGYESSKKEDDFGQYKMDLT
jgi:hypothetical protein